MTNIANITFSPNSAIDAEIKDLLSYFSPGSQARMQKAILNAKRTAEKHRDETTDAHARHIFREFIPASILNRNGFAFEYGRCLQGITPDWLDESARLMLESYTYERSGTSGFLERVTSAISGKCNRYKGVVSENSLRFMVAVYLDFFTGMLLDECREDVESLQPLFAANESLWAILFFTETHFIGRTQFYEFLCLCADSSFKAFPNWPFDTISLSD